MVKDTWNQSSKTRIPTMTTGSMNPPRSEQCFVALTHRTEAQITSDFGNRQRRARPR